MLKNEDGFSAVELLITLLVGSLFLFAFYQLYNSTYRMSQQATEEAYAFNMASTYLNETRYAALTEDDTAEITRQYPGARGEYVLTRQPTGTITPTLRQPALTVEYGPPDDRRTLTLSALVRYDGGLYY